MVHLRDDRPRGRHDPHRRDVPRALDRPLLDGERLDAGVGHDLHRPGEQTRADDELGRRHRVAAAAPRERVEQPGSGRRGREATLRSAPEGGPADRRDVGVAEGEDENADRLVEGADRQQDSFALLLLALPDARDVDRHPPPARRPPEERLPELDGLDPVQRDCRGPQLGQPVPHAQGRGGLLEDEVQGADELTDLLPADAEEERNARPDELRNAGEDADEEEDDAVKPLPERLVTDLTAWRTLALRNALAENPHVAMTALLHKLVLDTFERTSTSGTSLYAAVRHIYLPADATGLADSAAAKMIDERADAWRGDIPSGDDDRLWGWIDGLDDASRLALLAHCVSFGVNALYERPNPYSGNGISQHGLDRRMAEAERLAQATGLDLVEAGWKPTVENYLGRVTKTRILEAVREGAGDRAADLIAHLKKGDMAKEAERLLADTGWLPEPLRPTVDAQAVDGSADQDENGMALPDFLAGDDENAADAADDPVALVAAE